MHWSTIVNNSYILAIFGAVIGFIFALILARIQARGAPRKAISWAAEIEKPPQLDKGKEGKLGVSYNGVPVKDLVQVRVLVENTGNTVIKNEYVRFKLPAGSKILEVATDPAPEPELGVSEVLEPGLSNMERRYKIGHLEVGQNVRFLLATDGGAWNSWAGIYPFNEEGDVLFQRRDIARAREDVEEVRPFIRSAAGVFLLMILAIATPYPTSLVFAGLAAPLCIYIILIAPRIFQVVQRLISPAAATPVYSVNVGSTYGPFLIGDGTTQYQVEGNLKGAQQGEPAPQP
jgi:hypothetical protein